ncbi:hypothetical protein FACS1894137_13360 [Spirochaetia bacterium]|nr:hypothetical protein FACS1894137_13360 [Spirochaetia bacterium]
MATLMIFNDVLLDIFLLDLMFRYYRSILIFKNKVIIEKYY